MNTFRIYSSASHDLSLAIANGEVVLAKTDPCDDRQVWYKDMSYGAGIKDEAGSPAFNPLYVDESILWAERKEAKGGFRRIHMINNMELVWPRRLATRHAALPLPVERQQEPDVADCPAHSAVSAVPELARRVRILSQSGEGLSLTVRDDGTVVLATAEHKDERQCWLQSFHNTGRVTDEEGHPAFVLMNQATEKALGRRNCGAYQLVELADDCPDSVDVALLWTQSEDDLGEGFHSIRTVNDIRVVLDASNPEYAGVLDASNPEHAGVLDGMPIVSRTRSGSSSRFAEIAVVLEMSLVR